jgi:hypothetical protein
MTPLNGSLDTGRCRSARVLEGQSARSSGKRQSSRNGNSFAAPHHRGMPDRVSVFCTLLLASRAHERSRLGLVPELAPWREVSRCAGAGQGTPKKAFASGLGQLSPPRSSLSMTRAMGTKAGASFTAGRPGGVDALHLRQVGQVREISSHGKRNAEHRSVLASVTSRPRREPRVNLGSHPQDDSPKSDGRRIYVSCLLPSAPDSPCTKQQSVPCDRDWRMLTPLPRNDDRHLALETRFQFERAHHMGRVRNRNGPKDSILRPKRLGLTWQQLLLNTGTPVDLFRAGPQARMARDDSWAIQGIFPTCRTRHRGSAATPGRQGRAPIANAPSRPPSNRARLLPLAARTSAAQTGRVAPVNRFES